VEGERRGEGSRWRRGPRHERETLMDLSDGGTGAGVKEARPVSRPCSAEGGAADESNR
jgi:hypothetical protein